MLSDFSEGKLTSLVRTGGPFLLQCPKTKLVFKMCIEKYGINKYYVAKCYPCNGRFVHKENYVSPFNNSTFVMGSLNTIGSILASKNFFIKKGTG